MSSVARDRQKERGYASPISIDDARSRIATLVAECEKIQAQLGDGRHNPDRDWRYRAKTALSAKMAERRWLKAWIERRQRDIDNRIRAMQKASFEWEIKRARELLAQHAPHALKILDDEKEKPWV